jgi:hypothetical protein
MEPQRDVRLLALPKGRNLLPSDAIARALIGCRPLADMAFAAPHVRFRGKADMTFCGANVCFGPKADIAPSVRHNERDTNRACKRPRRTHIQLE